MISKYHYWIYLTVLYTTTHVVLLLRLSVKWLSQASFLKLAPKYDLSPNSKYMMIYQKYIHDMVLPHMFLL